MNLEISLLCMNLEFSYRRGARVENNVWMNNFY